MVGANVGAISAASMLVTHPSSEIDRDEWLTAAARSEASKNPDRDERVVTKDWKSTPSPSWSRSVLPFQSSLLCPWCSPQYRNCMQQTSPDV